MLLHNLFMTTRTPAIYICTDSMWIGVKICKNQKVPLEQLAATGAQSLG